MQAKLNKRFVTNIKPVSKRTFYWDTALRGFGIKIEPSGRRSFVLKYRVLGGSQRKPTIGQFPNLTVDEARVQANEMLRDVAKGKDPSLVKKEARQSIALNAFYNDRFVPDYAELHRKPDSNKKEKYLYDKHIMPGLGKKKIRSITSQDIHALHTRMKDTPFSANRTLALLKTLFTKAEEWGECTGPNPCRLVKMYKEQARQRYLSPAELSELINALNTVEENRIYSNSAINVIRFLLLSGCRKSEVTNLRWDNVDFSRSLLFLTDSKTGQKPVYLNKVAIAILDKMPRKSEWVFPGNVEGQPIKEIKRAWAGIRKMANLEDFRIHDLRHSHASIAAGLGLGLPIIGGLLGHSQASTTQRYAHLANDPMRAATDLMGNEFERLMEGTPANVVTIGHETKENQKAKG